MIRLARASSWEDPALLRALSVGEGDDVLVFEPSGDDALALTLAGARTVTAVLPDEAARALVELKRVAARELPIQSVRSLLGLGHFGRRVWFYHYLRPSLDAAVRATWDAAEPSIREGIVGAGAVERAMARFRESVVPLAVGRAAVEDLLAAPNLQVQRELFATRFAGLRWRLAARAALPGIARLADAPPEGASERLASVLARFPLEESPFAAWLLGGRPVNPDRAHPWLSADGLAALKPRVGALTVTVGARREVLGTAAAGAYSVVVLGRRPLDAEEAAALGRVLRPGGHALGWSPGVVVLPAPLVPDEGAGARLAQEDRGIFPGTPWLARR